ncbi:hypothetical protein ACIGO6_17595 [Streptomyces sp. NPDC053750]|uniref:hypothetical protein n=1 Tax=Streptomyces sp. NPDC053750 TaxID=3365714 RepID=UPI0037CF2A83
MRPKRYLALLGVPLGASFMLYPVGSAQAAETSPSVTPSQVCRAQSTAPPNPFGNVVGSGFEGAEQVRVTADGQVIATPTAVAGVVAVNGINLSARSYTLEGLTSGRAANCAGLAAPTPTPTDPGTGTGTTPTATRDEGRRDGLADGLAGCRLNRVVTDAQEDEEGPRNADYFAGYAAGKAEALNRTACLNRPQTPQTPQTGQGDGDQQNGQGQGQGQGQRDRDRDRDQQNRGGGNR